MSRKPMTLVKVDEPVWHHRNKLDAVRQMIMMQDASHVLSNWSIKYLNVTIDMRTGNFLLTEGNINNPSFLRISRSSTPNLHQEAGLGPQHTDK